MTDKVGFTLRGFDDYVYWQKEDKRTINRINKLITDIVRNGYEGIGNPERLKGNLSGYWSREIDVKNRIIYRIKENGEIEIIQCKGHYEDK